MNYRSIKDLNNIILKRLYIIPRDIDLIVGIPRSGMMPANLLALYLNKPFTDIDSFINGHIYKCGARGQFISSKDFKKILIVDDSIASGSAIIKSKEMLKDMSDQFDIKYCAIYVTHDKTSMADFYFEQVPLPRYFQWNILNHTILKKSCFDIDGVLCVDPSPEQNDDGEKYIDFIRNAQPLFIPGAPIGTIVTSRLEKYRALTEEWLSHQGIQYDKLIMLDLPDMAARQKANCHGSFKATEYAKSHYSLFIESEKKQALEINKSTSKPVLCTEDFEMIYNAQSVLYNIKSGETFPFIKKVLLALRSKISR